MPYCKPSYIATSFLNLTSAQCVWHERAESHELMDLSALVGHAQRHHYLQPNQITDYREPFLHFYSVSHSEKCTVKSAYCVTRDPKLMVGAGQVHFEKLHKKIKSIDGFEASSFREVRVLDNVEADGAMADSKAWSQRNTLDTKETKSFDSAELLHHRRKSSGLLSSMLNSDRLASQPLNTVSPFFEIVPHSDHDALDAGAQVHRSMCSKSPNNFLGNSFSTEDSPSSIKASGELSDDNDIALSIFDYELSCQPYFDIQLQEYQDLYGLNEDPMHLILSSDDGIKKERGRDRLPVWPDKAIPKIERIRVKIEEQEESIWGSILDYDITKNVGEAEEYMDMKDMEQNV